MLIMCGMSAVFSALFGTPLTATLFSMEVVSVGVFYYAALVPLFMQQFNFIWYCSMFWLSTNVLLIESSFSVNAVIMPSACYFCLIDCDFFHSFCFNDAFIVTNGFISIFHNPYIRVLVGAVLLMILVVFF